MKIGTKSLLWGAHAFWLHPWFVAAGWWKLYGFPFDPRLWVAFVVHDIGYFGKPNMDGPEGEEHVMKGAEIMGVLFDGKEYFANLRPLKRDRRFSPRGRQPWILHPIRGMRVLLAHVCDAVWGHNPQGRLWYGFTFYHSRYQSRKYRTKPSRLCAADKLATALMPAWLYLPMTRATGELEEYMKGQGARTPAGERPAEKWLSDVQRYCREWAYEHKDERPDSWTGTQRDEARY